MDSCSLKVARAVEHLNALNAAADGFFKDKTETFVRLRGEPNSQRTKYVFRIEAVEDFPRIEWGIMIGDAVHCLRSALDQLVYGLASETSLRTQFPVCRTRREWIT